MSDLARAIAFAFRRKGVDAMPGADLRLLLAYDLRWFAPEDAKRVVQRAIETGVLAQDGDALRPTFEAVAIDIPMNFRPTTAVLEEDAPASLPRAPPPAAAPAPSAAPAPPAAPAPAPPAAAAPDTRAADDERRRRGLLISTELAQLIVRRRMGEDVAEEAARLEARLLTAAQARGAAP